MSRTTLVLAILLAVVLAGGSVFSWKALGWRKGLQELREAQRDLAGIEVYEAENLRLVAESRRPDVVLLGASLTLGWGELNTRFAGIEAVNRGLGGQLVPQTLLRFRRDVLDLQPKVVLIEGAAINAIYEVPLQTVLDSYESMADLARLYDIEPILATIVPVGSSVEAKEPGTNSRVRRLNDGIRDLAKRRGVRLVDYYSAVADADGLLPESGTADGLHWNSTTYETVAEVLLPALRETIDAVDRAAKR